jgi:septum formation protein
MKIILASASPRRASLFRQLKIDFETDPSEIAEIVNPALKPSELVTGLSEQKGRDVAVRHNHALIIAADTIVCFKGRVLGKPGNSNEATGMLKMLSDQTHEVYSGVWAGVTDPGGVLEHTFSIYERTKVTFSPLSDSEINYYIASGSPMDKAGAYGIQDDFGALFVKGIEGDFYNVVGFPLHAFYTKLRQELPVLHKSIFFGTNV